jgi:hypothetical protein
MARHYARPSAPSMRFDARQSRVASRSSPRESGPTPPPRPRQLESTPPRPRDLNTRVYRRPGSASLDPHLTRLVACSLGPRLPHQHPPRSVAVADHLPYVRHTTRSRRDRRVSGPVRASSAKGRIRRASMVSSRGRSGATGSVAGRSSPAVRALTEAGTGMTSSPIKVGSNSCGSSHRSVALRLTAKSCGH